MRKTRVSILIVAVPQLLLIANWKIGYSKRLFDVYYGRVTHQLKSTPVYPIVFKFV